MLSMFLSLYTMSMFRLSGTRPTGRSDTFANAADDHVGDTGGAYRDRTDDLLNANQALSQLS